MMAAVRLAATADLEVISSIEEAAFPEPWSAATLRHALSNEQHLALVAELDHTPCGYALYQLVAPTAELLRIGVMPRQRRLGVARRLLEKAQQELDRRGIRETFLEVRRGNLAARDLYRQSGYREVGQRPRYYPNGEDAILCCRLS
jgi:ribosomal-protein-alanine N-acetyltransferase